jgi:hypothetical protein
MGSSLPNSIWECRCPGNSVATPAKQSFRRQVRYQTEFGNEGLKAQEPFVKQLPEVSRPVLAA